MLRAVLLDLGGTLWPEGSDDDAERVARLRTAVPSIREGDALGLVRALATSHPVTDRQQTASMVATALRDLNLRTDVPVSVVAARCACQHGAGSLSFRGPPDLVRGLAQRDLRVVIVSNVVWRDAAS
jgi:hypothetical protein